MSDKNQRPQSGDPADFDDLNDLDVPTYQGKNPLPPREAQKSEQQRTSSVKKIFEQEPVAYTPTGQRSEAATPAEGAAAGAAAAGAAAAGAGAAGIAGAGVPGAGADAAAQDSSRPDIYERTGRAAPERIEPAQTKAAKAPKGADRKADSKVPPIAEPQAQTTPPTETISMNRREPTGADNETTQFSASANQQSARSNQPSGSSVANDPQFYTTDFDYTQDQSQDRVQDQTRAKQDTNPNARDTQVTGVGTGAAAVDNTAVPVAPAPGPTPTATQQVPAQQYQDYDNTTVTPATEERAAVDARRGTIDFGLLLLRILLGGYLIFESVQTFFRLGNGSGLSGLESEFAAYDYGNILAIGLPTAQLAAGVFLVLGLLTPVAAMVATVATGFVALHAVADSGQGFSVFDWNEAIWLALILFGIAAVLQFTGPGLYSFDTGRGWARRPLASSWVFVILGIAALVAVWIFGTGLNPFA